MLVIASARYRRVGDGTAVADLHRGVQYETAVLPDLLHGDRSTWLPKLLPIVLRGHTLAELPLFLQPYTASHFVVSAIGDAGLDELLRVLTGQPRDRPPRLGFVPVLPPSSDIGESGTAATGLVDEDTRVLAGFRTAGAESGHAESEQVEVQANASRHGRVYQAGRDMHLGDS